MMSIGTSAARNINIVNNEEGDVGSDELSYSLLEEMDMEEDHWYEMVDVDEFWGNTFVIHRDGETNVEYGYDDILDLMSIENSLPVCMSEADRFCLRVIGEYHRSFVDVFVGEGNICDSKLILDPEDLILELGYSVLDLGDMLHLFRNNQDIDLYINSLANLSSFRLDALLYNNYYSGLYSIDGSSNLVLSLKAKKNGFYWFIELEKRCEVDGVIQYKSVNKECTLSEFLLRYPQCIMFSNQAGYEEEMNFGNSKTYAKLKTRNRRKHLHKQSAKLLKVAEELDGANLGSRKKHTKKSFKKKLKTQHVKLKYQSGTISKNEVIEMMEKFLTGYLAMYYKQPIWLGITMLLTLIKGSITMRIYDAIKFVFSTFEGKQCTLEDFVNWFKDLSCNVEKFTVNKYAKSFVECVSKLVSSILCPDVMHKWDKITSNSIVSKVLKFFSSIGNPLECIVNSITYIINGVQVFIKTGTMEGFVVTETLSDSLAHKLVNLRADYGLYKTGDLEFIKHYKTYEFLKQLQTLQNEITFLRKSKKGIDLKQLDDSAKEVQTMIAECLKCESHNSARVQPYHVILTSGSGISKTSLMKLIANTIAAHNNIPNGPEYTYFLNQANKFQSQWKNYVTTVMVDDSAAMHADSSTTQALNLADWLLRASNNAPHELLGAGVEEKGTMYNRSLISVWASNSFSQQFEKYARFASAINRRIHMRILARVKSEYAKEGSGGVKSTMIDYDKIPEEERNSIAPNAWLFECVECEIKDSPMKFKRDFAPVGEEVDNQFRFVTMKNTDGKLMKDIDINELLNFLVEHSSSHFKKQLRVLDINEKLYDTNNYCGHGLPVNLKCNKCLRASSLKTINKFMRDYIKSRRLVKIKAGVIKSLLEKSSLTKVYEPYKVTNCFGIGNYSLPWYDVVGRRPNYYCMKACHEWKITDDSGAFCHNGILYKFHIEKSPVGKVLVDNDYCSELSAMSEVPEDPSDKFFGNLWEAFRTEDTAISQQFVKQEHNDSYFYHLMLRCQSGLLGQITYCKKLMECVSDMKVDGINDRIDDLGQLAVALKSLLKSLTAVFSTWFDTLVCDVLEYIIGKIILLIDDFVSNPWAYIPTYLEGTIAGMYAYSKHPLLRIAMGLDYVDYVATSSAYRLATGKALRPGSDTINNYSKWSTWVYNNFLKSSTKAEKDSYRETLHFSPSEFGKAICSSITNSESRIKKEDPNLVRDVLIPGTCTFMFIKVILPQFVRNFSSLYATVQTGYEMSVEEVKALDKTEVNKWYLNRQEVMRSPVLCDSNRNVSELEHTIIKNLFFCRCDIDGTYKVVTALSFKNKYIILPKHYVEECMNRKLTMVRKEISSYEFPANNLIEFYLDRDIVFDLPLDLSVVYVEKSMDHMRTKDILDVFPTQPNMDNMNGKLIYRQTLGQLKVMPAIDITFNSKCNVIERIKEGLDSYQGYHYAAETFSGLCGAILVDQTHKKSHILGVHLGGDTNCNIGMAGFVKRIWLEDAINHFEPIQLKQSGVEFIQFGKKVISEDVYKKNPVLDTTDRIDGVEVLGSSLSRVSPVSKVVYTPIKDDVKKLFNVTYEFGAPSFKHDGDKRHGVRTLLRAFSEKRAFPRIDLVKRACLEYREDLLVPVRNEFWKEEIRILNDFEIVNGVAGKRFLGGLNMSSSFAYSMPGSKKKYAKQVGDVWVLDDFVWDEFKKLEDKALNGEVILDLVQQHLKLEATPVRKIEVGKVRSFFMYSTPMQMLIRKYFLTTCRFFNLNTGVTECTVGINPHSGDWTKFMKEVTIYGRNRMVPLDFKNFDLNVKIEILSKVLDILFVPFLTKYQEPKYKRLCAAIKHAFMYINVDLSGDIVCLHGILPSGTNFTSLVGCVMNSIYYRIAFYKIHGIDTDKKFRDFVVLRTYGDDSLACVSKLDSKVNVRTILQAWEELGIPATNMEKTSSKSSKKFYKLEEVEFLKRRLVYSPDFEAYIAPLNKESMFKSLMCHVPPKTISLECLTGQCIDNFLFEAKFHGSKFYGKSRRILKELAIKHDLLHHTKSLDITYKQMVDVWKEENQDVRLVTEEFRKSSSGIFRRLMSFNWDLQNWFEWTQEFNENITKDQNRAVVKSVVPDRTKSMTFSMQSGEEKEVEKVELVTFLDNSDKRSIDIGRSNDILRRQLQDCTLDEFFRRPVKIYSELWGPTNTFGYIEPWQLLLQNKRVSNRVNNFNLFSATLKLKVMVNGNGFYYGRMMLTYNPVLTSMDVRSNWPSGAAQNSAVLTLVSQRPHVQIDPTTSNTAEMTIPFFYPYPYLGLTEVYDSGSSIGYLSGWEIAPLKHANHELVQTDTLTISYYAWFEDVVLQAPTENNAYLLSAQSGREDETVKKPISQAATNVAKAASMFKQVPVIGPYATGVETGAKVASAIASSLGYCKPVNVEEPKKLQPAVVENMAVCNTTSNVGKLTVDIKNDLTIDSRIVGLKGKDELSISHISQVPTLVNTFIWNLDSAVDTVLQSYMVTPCHYGIFRTATSDHIAMTACCGAAYPFSFWRGSIIFHVQVIGSAFHRGRLLLQYDPIGPQSSTASESNVSYTEVIDIATTRDFEVKLGNFQANDWIKVPTDFPFSTRAASTAIQAGGLGADNNGIFSIRVLNSLTAATMDPTINNDITVAVFVRAGEDFEVSGPRSLSTLPSLKFQSGEENISGSGPVDEVGRDSSTSTHDAQPSNQLNKVYMGEVVDSFRTLIKRYNYYGTFLFEANTNLLSIKHPIYPTWPEYPDDVLSAAANNFNGCKLTLSAYVRSGFVGIRGSQRWMAVINTRGGGHVDATAILARDYDETPFYSKNASGANPTTDHLYTDFLGDVFSGASQSGMALTASAINPVLTAEIPFYEQMLFYGARESNPNFNTIGGNGSAVWRLLINCGVSPPEYIPVHVFTAAGEDQNYLFFIGWPMIYLPVGV